MTPVRMSAPTAASATKTLRGIRTTKVILSRGVGRASGPVTPSVTIWRRPLPLKGGFSCQSPRTWGYHDVRVARGGDGRSGRGYRRVSAAAALTSTDGEGLPARATAADGRGSLRAGHHRRGHRGGQGKRRARRNRLRLLAAHDLLRARQRVRGRLPRRLHDPAEGARPAGQVLRT